jgi:hypothetical protein
MQTEIGTTWMCGQRPARMPESTRPVATHTRDKEAVGENGSLRGHDWMGRLREHTSHIYSVRFVIMLRRPSRGIHYVLYRMWECLSRQWPCHV